MQYHSRAVAPASPSAASTMNTSVRSSASSSRHSDDGSSSSSLVLHSEEEDLGDPEVLAFELCGFFGGEASAPPKPKKVKTPKQKTVKVDLSLEASAAGAKSREPSRLRRLCKAIVPGSKA